ncbi:MAG: hypothetical protein ACRDKG_06645 [Actinomycetota bacterium]
MWTQVGAILLALALIIALNGTAAAVHDVGVFQLDGNAQTTVQSTPSASEDWDLICKAHPSTCTFKAGYPVPAGSTAAVASSHVNDGSLTATIFTGGGSKDPEDISAWRWKDEAGGLPDKDNLLHAYAARYSVAPSSSCPAGTGTSCELIYFGSDRFDNSGDAHQAFWFLQNKISLSNLSAGSGFKFNGVHKNGDLLIISEFSNGGTTSEINVYKWNAGALQFVVGGAAQKCGGATTDAFCGIVNPADGTVAPWGFLDKSGNTNFATGEFFEAGINLSDPSINLANQCFSSVLAETRSSTSTTATLKDFVLGEFATCSGSMTTTPSAGAGGIVAPGTSVTDVAVIQGTGASNPPSPTGQVTFFLCGPIASGTCTTGGTNIGTGTLQNTAPPAGEATATSPAVNTSGNPLAPGRYCFRATWPGDINYPDAVSHSGTGNSECFFVQDTTSMTTAQRWLPNDSATITSGAGGTVSGSLVFSLYSNLANCNSGGATGRLYTESFTLTNAASPATRTTTNNAVLVTTTSQVWWRVVFTSSDPNLVGSSSTCSETTSLTITN